MDLGGLKPVSSSDPVIASARSHAPSGPMHAYRRRPEAFRVFSAAVVQMTQTQPDYSARDLADVGVPVAIVTRAKSDEFITRGHTEYRAHHPWSHPRDPSRREPLRAASEARAVQSRDAHVSRVSRGGVRGRTCQCFEAAVMMPKSTAPTITAIYRTTVTIAAIPENFQNDFCCRSASSRSRTVRVATRRPMAEA